MKDTTKNAGLTGVPKLDGYTLPIKPTTQKGPGLIPHEDPGPALRTGAVGLFKGKRK